MSNTKGGYPSFPSFDFYSAGRLLHNYVGSDASIVESCIAHLVRLGAVVTTAAAVHDHYSP